MVVIWCRTTTTRLLCRVMTSQRDDEVMAKRGTETVCGQEAAMAVIQVAVAVIQVAAVA